MASIIQLVRSKKQVSLFLSTCTESSPAVTLSEGRFFTTFLAVASETHWKENFSFNLNILHFIIGGN